VDHAHEQNRPTAIATAILLGISLAVPATAGAVQSDAHSNIEKHTPASIRIDNFGRVTANYYRGAQPAGHDYADQAAGIKTVIDLTEEGDAQEAAIVQGLGMEFHRIPMTTHETPSSETVHEFLTLVNDPVNQPVYVHCQGGRNRTGVMTAVYRMTTEGVDGRTSVCGDEAAQVRDGLPASRVQGLRHGVSSCA